MTIALAILNRSVECPLPGDATPKAFAVHKKPGVTPKGKSVTDASPFGLNGTRLVLPHDLAVGDVVTFKRGKASVTATVATLEAARLVLVEATPAKPATATPPPPAPKKDA